MYFGAFHDAMFEVAGVLLPRLLCLSDFTYFIECVVMIVDIWSSEDSVHAYVHFLTMLWVCLTKDGIAVASLPQVKPFNLVAFEKCEGEIRGPATVTATMAPVSFGGNSNWFNGVSLPSTFFPRRGDLSDANNRKVYYDIKMIVIVIVM